MSGFQNEISPADPTGKNQRIGFRISNLAITRRQDRLRSTRFLLSAYFCMLFLVRWVPGLKSFNLIDFMNLGVVRVGFVVHPGSIWGPTGVHPGSIRGPSGVHPGSIRGPSRVHLGSIQGPSGVHPESIQSPSRVQLWRCSHGVVV